MIFDGDVNFFRVHHWGTDALGKDQRFLHVPVDLEQVTAHLCDLWNRKGKYEFWFGHPISEMERGNMSSDLDTLYLTKKGKYELWVWSPYLWHEWGE